MRKTAKDQGTSDLEDEAQGIAVVSADTGDFHPHQARRLRAIIQEAYKRGHADQLRQSLHLISENKD